jgi:hypothetical protein
VLFRSLKDYKTECEPGFCAFQVAQECRYLEFGQLDPVFPHP